MRQPQDGGPHVGRGRPAALENLEQLINVRAAGKQWHTRGHFCKNTADGPHVDSRAVTVRSEQEFGRAVPKCNDLERIRTVRNGG